MSHHPLVLKNIYIFNMIMLIHSVRSSRNSWLDKASLDFNYDLTGFSLTESEFLEITQIKFVDHT